MLIEWICGATEWIPFKSDWIRLWLQKYLLAIKQLSFAPCPSEFSAYDQASFTVLSQVSCKKRKMVAELSISCVVLQLLHLWAVITLTDPNKKRL